MGRGNTYRNCKRCGRPGSEVGGISWGGNCQSCGVQAFLDNTYSLIDHSGEPFKKWRKGCLAAFGVIVMDEPPPSE